MKMAVSGKPGRSKLSKKSSKKGLSVSKEHRVLTPRPDLVVLRIGPIGTKQKSPSSQNARAVVQKIAAATRKPGIQKRAIFTAGKPKKVYAYSILPSDVGKLVREDAKGKKTIGRIVNGRFRAIKTRTER